MMTKEILLEQFTSDYNENGWVVALKKVLVNLTAEQVSWKVESPGDSILTL